MSRVMFFKFNEFTVRNLKSSHFSFIIIGNSCDFISIISIKYATSISGHLFYPLHSTWEFWIILEEN